MKYKIKGIHCEACNKLIKMELDDAGFKEVQVDQVNEELIVPDEYVEKIDDIKEAVKKAGDYELLQP